MRVRQVVLVVDDLEAAAKLLTSVFGIDEAYRESPELGLEMENIVLPVGDAFLEVLVGSHERSPAERYRKNTGAGGYMLLFQYEAFDEALERATAGGVRVVWEFESPEQRERHLHPKDVGGAIVALNWASEWGQWRWAGPAWQAKVQTDRVSALVGVEVSSDRPAALASRWHEIFGLELCSGTHGEFTAAVDGQSIRLVPWDRAGSRVTGVDLLVTDMAKVLRGAVSNGVDVRDDDVLRLLGVDFHLVASRSGEPARAEERK